MTVGLNSVHAAVPAKTKLFSRACFLPRRAHRQRTAHARRTPHIPPPPPSTHTLPPPPAPRAHRAARTPPHTVNARQRTQRRRHAFPQDNWRMLFFRSISKPRQSPPDDRYDNYHTLRQFRFLVIEFLSFAFSLFHCFLTIVPKLY